MVKVRATTWGHIGLYKPGTLSNNGGRTNNERYVDNGGPSPSLVAHLFALTLGSRQEKRTENIQCEGICSNYMKR